MSVAIAVTPALWAWSKMTRGSLRSGGLLLLDVPMTGEQASGGLGSSFWSSAQPATRTLMSRLAGTQLLRVITSVDCADFEENG